MIKAIVSALFATSLAFTLATAIVAEENTKDYTQGELDLRAIATYSGISFEQYLALKNFLYSDKYSKDSIGILDLATQPAMLEFKYLTNTNQDVPAALQSELEIMMSTLRLQISNYTGIPDDELNAVLMKMHEVETFIEKLDKIKIGLTQNSTIQSSDDDVEVITIVLTEDKLEESKSGGNTRVNVQVYSRWSGLGSTVVRVIYRSSASGSYLGSQNWLARNGFAFPTGNLVFNGNDASLEAIE